MNNTIACGIAATGGVVKVNAAIDIGHSAEAVATIGRGPIVILTATRIGPDLLLQFIGRAREVPLPDGAGGSIGAINIIDGVIIRAVVSGTKRIEIQHIAIKREAIQFDEVGGKAAWKRNCGYDRGTRIGTTLLLQGINSPAKALQRTNVSRAGGCNIRNVGIVDILAIGVDTALISNVEGGVINRDGATGLICGRTAITLVGSRKVVSPLSVK